MLTNHAMYMAEEFYFMHMWLVTQETLKKYTANARDIFDNHFSEEVVGCVV